MKTRLMLTLLSLVAWCSAFELYRKARRQVREAHRELRLAVMRNDETLNDQRNLTARFQELHVD